MTTFTVMWRYTTRDGVQRERLIEADTVNVAFDARTPDTKGTSQNLGIYNVPGSGLVVLGNPEEGAESMALAFGDVFVMNRDGKTVAKYHLAKDPPWEDHSDTAPDYVLTDKPRRVA